MTTNYRLHGYHTLARLLLIVVAVLAVTFLGGFLLGWAIT